LVNCCCHNTAHNSGSHTFTQHSNTGPPCPT
jgi:hypothetical protein